MKLFADLDNYVATRSHFAVPSNELVDVFECAKIAYNSLLAMHILRQESKTSAIIQEYAQKTLMAGNQTNLHEFLHVMHTQVLREHSANSHSAFTSNELAVQLRVTTDFLQALAESTYDVASQNTRLITLETGYRMQTPDQHRLRRDVRSWSNAEWDQRYQVCHKLWENLHSAQGLLDLQHTLKSYIAEQKWPAPGSGKHTQVYSASNKMSLINRLPKLKEAADPLIANQAVKQLEKALTTTTNYSGEHIDRIMRDIATDLHISVEDLHNAFEDQHQMNPDNWIRSSKQQSMRNEALDTVNQTKWNMGPQANQPTSGPKNVKLVKLDPSGNESRDADAIASFATQDQARAQHAVMVKQGAGRQVAHNLYQNGKLVGTLKNNAYESLTETASGGATASGSVASIANPVGGIQRRPSLFGYIPETDDEEEEQENT